MRIISMMFVLLVAAMQAFATGNISGKVSDGKNGEAIIGATIMVKGTTRGTQTDVDGNFTLPIDAGTYTIEIKYIGYQTKEVDDIKVTDNNTVTVNTTITEAKATELQEVVVRSSLKKENISSLYLIQKNSAAISDGISADVIKKSPDRSTGEVLKRVSGTTIQDNKFVIIRGLSDRYNIGMVDNAILPSTEPNRKAFSFDIIPSSLVDNIIITKAATPDLPGDFAGGVINILTKEVPEQSFATVSLGASYNTVSTFKDFKSGYKSSTDFLSFDNGARKLPESMPSTNTINTTGLTEKQNIDAISKLNNNYSITTREALPGMSLQASAGKVYSLKGNKRIGIVGAINYSHNETVEPNISRYYIDYNYTDNVYKYSSNLGALLNIGYTSAKSKIALKALYNNIFEDNFLERTGLNNASGGKHIVYYAYDLQQKSLFKTSLEGEHRIGAGQSKLGWILNYNHIGNQQPDQRKLQYFRDNNGDLVADIDGLSKVNNRLFSTLGENVYSANVNYSQPVSLFNKTLIKVGAFTQYRGREFDARFLGLVLNPLAPSAQETKLRGPQNLFDQQLVDQNVFKLNDQTSSSDKYDATTTNFGGYVMIDNKFTEKLRLVWGARLEDYSVKLNSMFGTTPLTVDNLWLDILPSANLTYSLTDKINLRGSYYKTVARPELRELAPFSYYDYELSANISGRSTLQRSQINNADLRFEYYPAAGEILSASFFYKHFNKTIENYVDFPSSAMEVTTQNYDQAQNIGAEIEIRKKLGFISDDNKLFRNLTFYTNLAIIKSRVTGGDTSSVTGIVTKIDRPLAGQSNYVINGGLSYSAMEGKLNVNVLFNRIGQRIYLVGATAITKPGNVWEMPRNVLDAQIAYNVSKRSEFRLNVKDILNSKVLFYYDQNRNNKYDAVTVSNENAVPDPKQDMILKSFRPGTTFSLTYTYKF